MGNSFEGLNEEAADEIKGFINRALAWVKNEDVRYFPYLPIHADAPEPVIYNELAIKYWTTEMLYS